jgi:hypothetical protein
MVKELMGHSVIQMTERYWHLAPENTLRSVEILEEVIEQCGRNHPGGISKVVK